MNSRPRLSFFVHLAIWGGVGAGLSACQDTGVVSNARASRPIPAETVALMHAKGTDAHQPILIRTYKKEAEFEIWKMKSNGEYTLLKTFPMCRWSGQLGPKTREGDRQVPEGFYAITPGQMNPNSNYYLSFNVGYPNAYDRALGHSGGMIMVHGACSSAGCFSMTDAQIAEIYSIAREAFGGGQREIQMQSLPFHMTAENIAKHRLDPNMPFWRQLKQGSDHFEVAKREPTVGVCGRHYVFDAQAAGGGRLDPDGACPPLAEDPTLKSMVAAKEQRDEARIAELINEGVKPVRIQYADGGQHPDFAKRTDLEDVSRPEALAAGPVETVIEDAKSKKAAAKLAAKAGHKGDSKPQSGVTSAAKATDQAAPAADAPIEQSENAAGTSHVLGLKKAESRSEPEAPPPDADKPKS